MRPERFEPGEVTGRTFFATSPTSHYSNSKGVRQFSRLRGKGNLYAESQVRSATKPSTR